MYRKWFPLGISPISKVERSVPGEVDLSKRRVLVVESCLGLQFHALLSFLHLLAVDAHKVPGNCSANIQGTESKTRTRSLLPATYSSMSILLQQALFDLHRNPSDKIPSRVIAQTGNIFLDFLEEVFDALAGILCHTSGSHAQRIQFDSLLVFRVL